MQKGYLVAGCKPWNLSAYQENAAKLPGRWMFIGSKEELDGGMVREFSPRYIFFLHWSWKVPAEIVSNYECICFHMTDVPYGRGGSPLQNLIMRGHRETKLTSLRMTDEVDGGPVYFKEPLSLEGNAEEIYLRASRMSCRMMERIAAEEPVPIVQEGNIEKFIRRKPAESSIEGAHSLEKMHDFIRMLDADGYPRAFLEYGGFRFEFSRPGMYNGRIVADVKITKTTAEEAGN